MSLPEIFAALRRGWWIIIAVIVIAVAIALVVLSRIQPSYVSSGTIRANPYLSTATLNGQVAGVTVDIDPSVMLTTTVLDPAAQTLGTTADQLQGSVSYSLVPDSATTTIVVSGKANAPDRSQAIAQAVITAYSNHVTQTFDQVATTLQDAVNATTGQVQSLQAQLVASPTDPVVSQNLAAALTTLSTQTGRLSEVQNAGNLLTVTAPVEPGASTTPSALTVLALALLCGLLAGIGLVLIIDRLDGRLRPTDDVEELTGVKVIAELPYDRSAARRRRKNRLPAADGRQGVLGERLRSLRTSTQVLLPDGKGVVVLTSVEPGDGKTFVSSNLAVSWSRAGRKVILVSGDMRRPEVQQYFPSVEGQRGLSDLLALRVPGRRSPTQPQIEETLVGTGFRGLRVLPPGSETDNAADLLGGANLPRVLGFAARIADVVVVDSPPTLALTDASELARSADGVVLIVSVRRTRRRLLREAVDTLLTNDVPILGIVVNRSRRRLPRTYASYYTGERPSATRSAAPSSRRALGGRDQPRDRSRDRERAIEEVPVVDDEPVDILASLTGRERRLAALTTDDSEDR